MANGGWYGSQDEWQRIERPLCEVDPILEKFSIETGIALTKNHKDWAERSLTWGDGVRCLIQLYLVDEKDLKFNLWICASQDREGNRYWMHDTLIKDKPVEEFENNLSDELKAGHLQLMKWSQDPDQFEHTTVLR